MEPVHQAVVPVDMSLTWPSNKLPLEIFELITSNLSRTEIQNLRLTCREFETKISGLYFKNVVVPFRSQLYTDIGPDENGTRKNPTSSMFSDGMRIFESFGPHILRFALSLELNENLLAIPPTKPLQEAIPAFWGLYRWPHENYHRYSDLEGLEQAADETASMKKALRCLDKVTTLGLCCDAGLGFLYGPDTVARASAPKSRVFTQRRSHAGKITKHDDWFSLSASSDEDKADNADGAKMDPVAAGNRALLESMALEAGYSGEQTSEVLDLLLTTEGKQLINADIVQHSSSSKRNGPSMENGTFAMSSFKHPLDPVDLTMSQKEFLLELEWAHRAMIQSYVIGLTDNAADGCFQNLTTFTIAKIPSSHLPILQNKAFWTSFPALNNVSLGVVADWRRITRTNPGCIVDTEVSPVEAVPAAFITLNDYIGKCANIETLHFEWICGGELATSFHQRNQYILPAPFCPEPTGMASPFAALDGDLLDLPHVKHLSLKNCWFSPHAMLQSFRQMALSSLETLELESVSMSGPPSLTPTTAITPVQIGPAHVPTPFYNGGTAHDVLGSSSILKHAVTVVPYFSWAGILDHFSPGPKLRHVRTIPMFEEEVEKAARNEIHKIREFVPAVANLPSEESAYKLTSISLTSCGYAAVDMPFLSARSLNLFQDPFVTLSNSAASANQRQDLVGRMQVCKDKMAARLLPYIAAGEMNVLAELFGMVLGWDSVYDKETFDAALLDGYEFPGLGRFSGQL